MICSDLANCLAEMIFKETVDRTNKRAIMGFVGNADGRIKAPANWFWLAEFEVGEKQCREFVSCLINCVNWLDFSIYFWWEQHRRTWTEDALLLG